jgi:hypothetical protein
MTEIYQSGAAYSKNGGGVSGATLRHISAIKA